MPGSTVLRLTDPYEYQAAMGRAEAQKSIITGSGSYLSELTLVDLHCVGLQQGRLALPRIVHAAPSRSLCNIGFPTADNQARVTFNGIEAPQSCLSFYCPGAEYVVAASAECAWGGISLTPDTLVSTSQALLGYEVTPPKATKLICAPSAMMARLLSLHEAASRLAAMVPDIIRHHEVARAIEQELLHALVGCLADAETIENPRTNRHGIMRRFQELIEANQNEPMYLAEVCAAIGTTERTLRNACGDYLGMSPQRYLWLRRMNQARRALATANAASASVSTIANDHGFAELGRFAVAYRELFGESPSETLRKVPN
jgi:AraC-like DNA-binding protein